MGWPRSNGDDRDRSAGPPARRLPLHHRAGHLYRRHQPHRPALRLYSAQPARQCPHYRDRHLGRCLGAGCRCGLYRQGYGCRHGRRTTLRLADHSKDGSPMVEPPHPPLVTDRVRHVGDQVAAVIADSLGQARDAAELIQVDYVEEPAAIGPVAALQSGAPQVHPEAPGNLCYDWHLGDLAAVDAAFAKAAKIVKLDLVNNRLVPNAMEPRAAIGEFNRATGEYTLYTTSQNPHVIRLLMGAFVLHIPEAKLRVVAPDVGGGFGSKIYHYAEEAIVTWAAGKVHRPVKWTAERSESFMSDAHGRDHVTHAELAIDAEAKFLALKVSTVANMGAYLSTFAPAIPTYLYGTLLAGTYTTPAVYCET